MRLLSTFVACLFLLAAIQKENPPRKIIDVHFHAHLSTDYGKIPPPNPVTGKIPKWKNDKDVIDQMLATLKANNVVKVIACGSLATIKEFQLADAERIIPALDYPDSQNNPLPDTASFIRYFLEKNFMYLVNLLFSMKERRWQILNWILILLFVKEWEYQ
jgi:uncharacterized protein